MTKERKLTNNNVQLKNEELNNLIVGLIDKGANYAIKSMSVGDQLKDLLLDIKKNLQNDSFKEMLTIAINGALKEGIDIENYNDYDFEELDDEDEFEEDEDIDDLVETSNNKINKKIDLSNLSKSVQLAFRGGLPQLINLAVEVATAAKKKNNIFSNYIEDFIGRVKTYIQSDQFKNKVNIGIAKCSDKVEKFKGLCAAWYNAYDILNVDQIKDIAKEIKEMKNKVKFDNECINENEVIQNITDIITKKGEKVSRSRVDIYENLHEI